MGQSPMTFFLSLLSLLNSTRSPPFLFLLFSSFFAVGFFLLQLINLSFSPLFFDFSTRFFLLGVLAFFFLPHVLLSFFLQQPFFFLLFFFLTAGQQLTCGHELSWAAARGQRTRRSCGLGSEVCSSGVWHGCSSKDGGGRGSDGSRWAAAVACTEEARCRA
jgi:hypothetical protein